MAEKNTDEKEQKYQERQELLKELNKLRERNEELEYYVNNIANMDFPKINLSEASDWLVKNEKQAGVDIKGYKHQVAKNFIYHALNTHGDEKTEKLRGNIAITNDDITNLKDVFESPDLVAFGLKRNGDDLIAYTKKFSNGTSIYLEEVLSGKKNKALRSKTLYKKAGEISEEKFRRIISSNPHNDCSKMNIALGEVAKSSVLRSQTNGIGGQSRNPTGYGSSIPQTENLSNQNKPQEKENIMKDEKITSWETLDRIFGDDFSQYYKEHLKASDENEQKKSAIEWRFLNMIEGHNPEFSDRITLRENRHLRYNEIADGLQNSVDNAISKTAEYIVNNPKKAEKLSFKDVQNLYDSYISKDSLFQQLVKNGILIYEQNSEIDKSQENEKSFTDDKKKMADFSELTKKEFLESHRDVNEANYDAAVAELKDNGEYTLPWNTIKEILGKDESAELDYELNLHIDEAYEPEEKEFLSKFDAAYFTIEKYISHRGLDMDTYKDLFGDISEETATEIEDEKRDILGSEVVEDLVKGRKDFGDFVDIQQAYDRALAKSKIYQKYAQTELTEAIGKRDNAFVSSIADYLNSAMRHYYENREPETAIACENILSEVLFTAETETNTKAFKTLLENDANVTYRKTEVIDGNEHKANILHYIAADDNTEALSLLMDGTSKPFDHLTAGEKLSLLREQNFEGRTPLEVSENYYREEPSRYEPDMIMPDVMRELAYQEEELLEIVPPVILTDRLTGNILMVEQNNGDGCEINLFDKNLKLIDHDNSSGYTNSLGESVDYESNLEAARVAAADYEKQGLWGNFYDYTRIADREHIKSLSDSLHKSRDEFFKTIDGVGDEIKKNGIDLYAVDNDTPDFRTAAKFEMFVPGRLLSELGIKLENGKKGLSDERVKIQMFIDKSGKPDGYHVDLIGQEDIQGSFTANAVKRFDAVIDKIEEKILEEYPLEQIQKHIRLEEARHFSVMDRVDLRDYLNAHKPKAHEDDFEYGFNKPDSILKMLSEQGKKLLYDGENNKIYTISENADLKFSNIGTLSELEKVTPKQLADEEKGTRTVTQSVTFPAHFIMAEKKSLSLLENLQDKYGFGEKDFEQFVNNGDVDIHFAAPVPKEYQFPKSKTDEWIKSVCKELEENFGSTDVATGMDGSERTERVFDSVEEAENFVAESRENTSDEFLDRKSLLADKKELTDLTKLYEINRDGKTKEINVKDFGLKNTREFSKNSQVEAEVTEKPIEQPQITISQNEDLSIKTENFSDERNTVARVGVAPTISALRFPEEQPATHLRPSPTTDNLNIPQKEEKSSEQSFTPDAIFSNFIKEANDEYKELKLIYQAAAKALKNTPPEQRKILDAELLKRGARSPEKLASIMQDAFRKLDEPEKCQKKNRSNDSYGRGR